MFNLGDGVVVELYDQVPWLLLLNVLAMILLLLLLYSSTILVTDNAGVELIIPIEQQGEYSESVLKSSSVSFSNNSISSRNSSQTKTKQASRTTHRAIAIEEAQEESGSEESEAEGRMKEIEGGEEEEEEPPTFSFRQSDNSYSPCHWLGIASKAFLSCLGLHSSPQGPPRKKLRKDPTTTTTTNTDQSDSKRPKQHQL